jgi:hypothetical protein
VDRRIDTQLSAQRYPYAERHTWNDTVNITEASGPAALLAIARPLELALGRPFQDLTFIADDGTVIYALPNGTSTDGVKVTNLRNAPNPGHLASAYYLEFTAEATYAFGPEIVGGPVLLEFRESIRYAGGGPRYSFVECRNARPIKFKLTDATVARATQSGSMRTLGDYGTIPDPLWPADLLPDQTEKITERAKNLEGVEEFLLSWKYEFGSGNFITL